ncbi:MAG: hypothetical protein ACT4P1_09050 [Sporichthyaceae bacterium]
MRRFSDFTRRVLRTVSADLRSAETAGDDLVLANSAPTPAEAAAERHGEFRRQSVARPFIPAQRNRRWATTF